MATARACRSERGMADGSGQATRSIVRNIVIAARQPVDPPQLLTCTERADTSLRPEWNHCTFRVQIGGQASPLFTTRCCESKKEVDRFSGTYRPLGQYGRSVCPHRRQGLAHSARYVHSQCRAPAEREIDSV
eukprot:scaffold201055_cov29-Tisochrysis_lutea.AAC.20